jgi:DNA-binding LytR/AlgR family response regulator
MNYIIAEDEKLTADRLKLMISSLRPGYNHLATFDTVSSAVKWLKQSSPPQLAFFDVNLADGSCFEIFEQADVPFPVIFTTAYSEYAFRAFKVNSIDYLLKPVNENDLRIAIEKFESSRSIVSPTDMARVASMINQLSSCYKSRFVVKVGEHIKMISCSSIAFFHSTSKSTFIHTTNGYDYAIDQTLEQVELVVDPAKFFRVNRSCIISVEAIGDIVAYSSSRLKIVPNVKFDNEIIVSRERVQLFKKWLER